MREQLPVRFWIETALAGASALLLIVTLVWHDWIETVFGVDPDASSGAAEWIIVGLALAITIGSIYLARREWARTQTAAATQR
jgi:hypothetical protein